MLELRHYLPLQGGTAAVALLGWILILAAGCRQDSTEFVRLNPQTFDAAQEALIGDRLMEGPWRNQNIALLEPDAGDFTDAAYDYLRPLLRELVDQDHVTRRDSFAWSIYLVLDGDTHAYTLPGGKLVVHTGLLHALPHEAACIGIFAREVALAETGAAMAAYDRLVEDNVALGDLILGQPTDAIEELIRLAPQVAYSAAELARADSLAARLVCGSNYDQVALVTAVDGFEASCAYAQARPTYPRWRETFRSRVDACAGADSLFAGRYRAMLRRAVPN